MFKNIGLHGISVISAIIVSAFAAAWYITLVSVQDSEFRWLWFSLLLISTLLFSYFLIRMVMEQYIYRRIKLIYKSIRSSKQSMPTKAVNLVRDNQLFEEVEEEVAEWTESREREITTLKTLEEYRKRYLGNISHELKTPIFSIQGFVHTLLDGAIHDPDVNVRYLERAADNVERMLNIVHDLETITKMESGELILEIEAFDLKELVLEVFEDLQIKADEKFIDLKFKEGADRAFTAKGDPEYIRQVFSNLIVNSIKYGNEGGVTKVSFYDMHPHLLVEVSDDGIGIPEHHLKHLFDRFYRVDKSRSRSHGGSGLGLSIVKHILEMHNQTINVRSTAGVGSTFGFTLDKA